MFTRHKPIIYGAKILVDTAIPATFKSISTSNSNSYSSNTTTTANNKNDDKNTSGATKPTANSNNITVPPPPILLKTTPPVSMTSRHLVGHRRTQDGQRTQDGHKQKRGVWTSTSAMKLSCAALTSRLSRAPSRNAFLDPLILLSTASVRFCLARSFMRLTWCGIGAQCPIYIFKKTQQGIVFFFWGG